MIRRNNKKRMFENRRTNRRKLHESIEYKDEMTAQEYRDKAWSGARDTLEDLTDDEIEQVFNMLNDTYLEVPTLTEINDFFWFERDTIAEWLGYNSYDELMRRDEEE